MKRLLVTTCIVVLLVRAGQADITGSEVGPSYGGSAFSSSWASSAWNYLENSFGGLFPDHKERGSDSSTVNIKREPSGANANINGDLGVGPQRPKSRLMRREGSASTKAQSGGLEAGQPSAPASSSSLTQSSGERSKREEGAAIASALQPSAEEQQSQSPAGEQQIPADLRVAQQLSVEEQLPVDLPVEQQLPVGEQLPVESQLEQPATESRSSRPSNGDGDSPQATDDENSLPTGVDDGYSLSTDTDPFSHLSENQKMDGVARILKMVLDQDGKESRPHPSASMAEQQQRSKANLEHLQSYHLDQQLEELVSGDSRRNTHSDADLHPDWDLPVYHKILDANPNLYSMLYDYAKSVVSGSASALQVVEQHKSGQSNSPLGSSSSKLQQSAESFIEADGTTTTDRMAKNDGTMTNDGATPNSDVDGVSKVSSYASSSAHASSNAVIEGPYSPHTLSLPRGWKPHPVTEKGIPSPTTASSTSQVVASSSSDMSASSIASQIGASSTSELGALRTSQQSSKGLPKILKKPLKNVKALSEPVFKSLSSLARNNAAPKKAKENYIIQKTYPESSHPIQDVFKRDDPLSFRSHDENFHFNLEPLKEHLLRIIPRDLGKDFKEVSNLQSKVESEREKILDTTREIARSINDMWTSLSAEESRIWGSQKQRNSILIKTYEKYVTKKMKSIIRDIETEPLDDYGTDGSLMKGERAAALNFFLLDLEMLENELLELKSAIPRQQYDQDDGSDFTPKGPSSNGQGVRTVGHSVTNLLADARAKLGASSRLNFLRRSAPIQTTGRNTNGAETGRENQQDGNSFVETETKKTTYAANTETDFGKKTRMSREVREENQSAANRESEDNREMEHESAVTQEKYFPNEVNHKSGKTEKDRDEDAEDNPNRAAAAFRESTFEDVKIQKEILKYVRQKQKVRREAEQLRAQTKQELIREFQGTF